MGRVAVTSCVHNPITRSIGNRYAAQIVSTHASYREATATRLHLSRCSIAADRDRQVYDVAKTSSNNSRVLEKITWKKKALVFGQSS